MGKAELQKLSPGEPQTETVSSCAHCALPLPAKPAKSFDSSRFCCAGCETVYKLIHTCGLESFYKHRETLGATLSPVGKRESTFHYFDDPLWIEEHCEEVADGYRVRFSVEAIHCAACVWLLERLPGLHEGILRASPSLADSTIEIVYQQDLIKPSQIAALVDSLGYRPESYRVDSAERKRKQERIALTRLGVAGFGAGNTMLMAISMYQGVFSGIEDSFLRVFQWTSLCLTLPVVFYSAMPFFRTAIGGLRLGVLHIDLPISIGILVGFFASVVATIVQAEHVYFDSVCALVFFLLAGRWVQQRLVTLARQRVARGSFLPEFVLRVDEDKEVEVLRERVAAGDLIKVLTNGIVPCDGAVHGAAGSVSNAHLSGEAFPLKVVPGQKVFAGARSLGDSLLLRVTSAAAESRIASLVKSVELRSAQATPFRELTQRLSGVFLLALLLASVVTVLLWWSAGVAVTLERLVALLVVSCPCALGLSAPLAAGLATSRALQRGIFIRSADVFERLAKVDHVVFDKTGTLTSGLCSVRSSLFISEEQECLAAVCALEKGSEHPVGLALLAFTSEVESELVFSKIEHLTAKGVQGEDSRGNNWQLGKVSWVFEKVAAEIPQAVHEYLQEIRAQGLTPVALSSNGSLLALFAVGDELHVGVAELIASLQQRGTRVSLLSGDEQSAVMALAELVGIDRGNAFSACSPEAKADYLQQWNVSGFTAMIGDGVNDSAALATAGVGIAVRGQVETALQSADIFVPAGNTAMLRNCFDSATETVKVIKRNLTLSLCYNVIGVSLAISGMITPLAAAIIMPLSSFTVILSSGMGRSFREDQ